MDKHFSCINVLFPLYYHNQSNGYISFISCFLKIIQSACCQSLFIFPLVTDNLTIYSHDPASNQHILIVGIDFTSFLSEHNHLYTKYQYLCYTNLSERWQWRSNYFKSIKLCCDSQPHKYVWLPRFFLKTLDLLNSELCLQIQISWLRKRHLFSICHGKSGQKILIHLGIKIIRSDGSWTSLLDSGSIVRQVADS